jgi:mediator of RNA polymerase II transcription subunit 20
VTFTSDTLFDLLLLKLGNVYSKKFKIESKGSRFEIGDFLVRLNDLVATSRIKTGHLTFQVKLGIVSVAGSFKGILVEVEYLPCVDVQSCWGLLCEFMQGFLGSVVSNQVPPSLKKKPGDLYTPVDTIQQYLEHFIAFRKSTSLQSNRQQQ